MEEFSKNLNFDKKNGNNSMNEVNPFRIKKDKQAIVKE